MKLIIGLGNPGKQYEKTRHNTGFMVLENFLKNIETIRQTVWENNEKLKSDIVIFDYQPKHGTMEKIILAKPKTYMNNSGMAVSLLAKFYKVASGDIWVVHDELDLPLGAMKIRLGGAGAGHHGVESIIEALGTDKFWRFRMGIGQSHNHDEMAKHNFKNGEDYVLGTFAGADMKKARELEKRGAKAIQEALEHGLEVAQHQFNTK